MYAQPACIIRGLPHFFRVRWRADPLQPSPTSIRSYQGENKYNNERMSPLRPEIVFLKMLLQLISHCCWRHRKGLRGGSTSRGHHGALYLGLLTVDEIPLNMTRFALPTRYLPSKRPSTQAGLWAGWVGGIQAAA